MKHCPRCNRTYDDDTFSFCTEDGALLSTDDDPEETLVLPQRSMEFPERITEMAKQCGWGVLNALEDGTVALGFNVKWGKAVVYIMEVRDVGTMKDFGKKLVDFSCNFLPAPLNHDQVGNAAKAMLDHFMGLNRAIGYGHWALGGREKPWFAFVVKVPSDELNIHTFKKAVTGILEQLEMQVAVDKRANEYLSLLIDNAIIA